MRKGIKQGAVFVLVFSLLMGMIQMQVIASTMEDAIDFYED